MSGLKKAEVAPHQCAVSTLMGGSKQGDRGFSDVSSDGIRGNGHKLKYSELHLNTGKPQAGCPESTWNHHARRYPQAKWCRADCFRCHCLSRRLDQTALSSLPTSATACFYLSWLHINDLGKSSSM